MAGRTRHGVAAAGCPNTSRRCYFCPRNVRVSGARNPDYQSVFVFDNDHPCVGADAPRALEPPPGIYRNAPATGVARVVCYTPKHNTTLAELPVAAIGALLAHVARSVPRARRAARGPPRADVREQGRGGRRVEPAPARADLRDELRLQDHRDRSRREPALLRGARPRALSGHHPRRSRTTDAGSCSRARRRSSFFRTSRGTPTSATSRRRRRTPAWRR